MSQSSSQSRGEDRTTHSEQSFNPSEIPTPFVWKIAAVLATSLVLGLLFLDLLSLLIRPLGLLFAAVVVALTLAPIVDWLERWLPRLAAVLLVYVSLVLILVAFGLVLIPPIVTQMAALIQDFPQHYRDVQIWAARELGMNVRNDMDQLAGIAAPAADYVLTLPRMIVVSGAEFLVGFFVSLYWLHSMPRMKAFMLSLFPPATQDSVETVMHRVALRMGGYMRGVALSGVVVGVVVYIGLMILGVQYALLLAVLAFLGEFFPNVGPILAGIPAVTVAFFESPTLALAVIIFYIVVQQLEAYILVPMIMMRTLAHIPPLVTTFAVFTGFMVGGVLWAILAIPLSGAILTLSTDVIAPAIRSRTGAREPDEVVVEGPELPEPVSSAELRQSGDPSG